jgi:hypothetical protein
LALVAFPLTAGFITLNALYTWWLLNNFWVLSLVLVLLLLPLITAVFIFVREHVDTNPSSRHRHHSPVSEIAQLLPAAGLLMINGFSVVETHWGTWLILLLTAAGALLLARYVGEVQETIVTVNTALSPDRLPLGNMGAILQKFARQLFLSLGEAANILEGDRGLLWLTAFLAILLIALSG